MRILHVNTYYKPIVKGGTEITMSKIAQGFAGMGYRVSSLSLSGTDGWVRESLDGVNVIRMPTPLPGGGQSRGKVSNAIRKLFDSYNIQSRAACAAVLDEVDPDIVLTHNLRGLSVSVWDAALKHRCKIIHVLHDYYMMCPNLHMLTGLDRCGTPCGKCEMFRIWHRRLSGRVDAVVGVSQSILDAHRRNGYFDGVRRSMVIYNARTIARPTKLRSRIGELTFGYIGGLTPVKGLHELVKSYSAVEASMRSPMRLLIAGDGDQNYVADLKRKYPSPTIEYLGYSVSGEFFEKIDVLVMPTLWDEPLGNVVYEAIAAGVPVIGSRRGGVAEIIKDSENGLLFEPTATGELDRHLRNIISDRSIVQRLSAGGYESVQMFTDEARMTRDYNNLVLSLQAERATQVAAAE
jgi:glycosyltransferase involved in cell wall biosynthesis